MLSLPKHLAHTVGILILTVRARCYGTLSMTFYSHSK